jgi:hypothetical protein
VNVMSDELVSAFIGAGATLVAAIIGWLGSTQIRDRKSMGYRRDLALVSPLGRWRCEWYRHDGTVYVFDDIEITNWVRNGRFRGKGVQPALSYSLEGEVDSTRVVALTYRTLDFPTKAYVGVACLEFNQDGNKLEGYWYGRATNGEFMGGVTKWVRLPQA